MHWNAVSHFLTSNTVRLLTFYSLAMAEMTTFLAALYRKYTTEPKGGFDVLSPGITSRFEVFYDEGCIGMRVRSI